MNPNQLLAFRSVLRECQSNTLGRAPAEELHANNVFHRYPVLCVSSVVILQ